MVVVDPAEGGQSLTPGSSPPTGTRECCHGGSGVGSGVGRHRDGRPSPSMLTASPAAGAADLYIDPFGGQSQSSSAGSSSSSDCSDNNNDRHIDQARANLLDSMVASSSTSSSETENESDTGDEDDYKYQQLHEIHRVRRFKKAADREQCVMRYIPPPRPSILDRKDFYFRYGEKEQEAVASFDFLESMSTSVSSEAGSAETLNGAKDDPSATNGHHHHNHHHNPFTRRSFRRIDVDNGRDFAAVTPSARKPNKPPQQNNHQQQRVSRNQTTKNYSPVRDETICSRSPTITTTTTATSNKKCSSTNNGLDSRLVSSRKVITTQDTVDNNRPPYRDLSSDVLRLSVANVPTTPTCSSQEGDLADRLSLSDSCAESFSRSSSSSLNLDA